MAIFILLIACINFMNLSTAKASRRIKEVGVKKAIGASRGSLIYQFFGESMLITLLSLILALAIAALFLPQLLSFSKHLNNSEAHTRNISNFLFSHKLVARHQRSTTKIPSTTTVGLVPRNGACSSPFIHRQLPKR